MPTVAMNLLQQASGETAVAAAMHSGMADELGRRDHYLQDAVNTGSADYGDMMDLTGLVYDNALPPASQPALYPFAGDEPIAVS